MKPLIITNFHGRLTRVNEGDLNSGLAKYSRTFGNDPFSTPGNLSWLEAPIAITVSNDLIVAGKVRLESGITYVYVVDVYGGLYKIQVNDLVTKNSNYDVASLVATLATAPSGLYYGASIQFYGATEKLYIGTNDGVTSINFDGSGEAFVGSAPSWTGNVPRPLANFLGKLYVGNGNNIAEIDSTGTVTTYAKLDPGFPAGTYVRDLDVSPDGNYLQIVVSRINSSPINAIIQDTAPLSSTDSYKFMWNGTDTGYTSYESFGGFTLTSNSAFGPFNYTLGYDLGGAAIYSDGQKIESLPLSISPNFEAMFSTGNLLGFASPEYVPGDSLLENSIMFYGQYDQETPQGMFRFLRQKGTNSKDVLQMPMCLVVSNLFYGATYAGYSGNVVGSAKLYFSSYEVDSAGNNFASKVYKFATVPTGLGTAIGGVYETQNQLFSKKVKPTQVRFYTEPLVANNSLTVDLIGSDGAPISGGSKTFTVGSNVTAGQDYLWYTPATASTYTIGVRITNLGSVNWKGTKLEIDSEEAGQ